jgi:hypothetical protein
VACDTASCIVVRCDCCQIPASVAGRPWHWPSRATAVSDLAGAAWGWSATADVQVCGACLARRRCDEVGHDWDPWQELPGLEAEDVSIRVCARCGLDERISTDCLAPRSGSRLGGKS